MRFVVLATPTCTTCKILKELVKEQGIEAQFGFVDSLSEEGKKLVKVFSIRSAGTIIDIHTNEVVSFEEAKERLGVKCGWIL